MARYKSYTDADFLEQVRSYITNQDDLDDIQKALAFAHEKHAPQKRKSGEPYMVHLVNVAYILATMHVSPITLQAGLLHDTVEDTDATFEELSEKFSPEIAGLVDSVTKIGNIQFKDEKEYLAENHRKIFIAMAKDVRVIFIKLVDRLHNMRTLEYHTVEKQKKISNETLSVYAPIAHRLGLNEIKNELEDLSFFYLHPESYYEVVKMVDQRKAERDSQVEVMIGDIEFLLDEHKIPHRVFGRSKHLYSIYKKMITKAKRFDEILDLLAIRIITDDEVRCYEILGYIHAKYRPIPGRLKDYIAMPKMNLYQSLHTTIVAEGGNIFEVQIRTEEMDMIAEKGIAAHWRYKEGAASSAKKNQQEIEEKLALFRDLEVLTEGGNTSAQEYMEVLQRDIFEANVYVMTPKGRVIDLPAGATPIDFAYRIHTEVGHSTVGSLVNGTLVPLNTELKTGDVVQIKTNKNNPEPSSDWLNFVKTNHARNKIRAFLQKKEAENRKDVITKGEHMYKQELKARELDEKEWMVKSKLEPIYQSFNLKSMDEFFYAIAVKSLTLSAVFEKINAQRGHSSVFDISSLFKQKPRTPRTVSKSGVIVQGIDTMMVSLAGCCSPVPGDEIIGYISKGKGVKVHRIDCPNIINEKARLISVQWDDQSTITNYEVPLKIKAFDRQFLLTDVVTVTSQNKMTIVEVNAFMDEDKIHSTINIRVLVKDAQHLRTYISNLLKVDTVISVERDIL